MADPLTIVGVLSGCSLLLNAATVFAAGRAWGRITERLENTRADVKEVRRDLNGVARKLTEKVEAETRALGEDLEHAVDTHLRDYHCVGGPRAATER